MKMCEYYKSRMLDSTWSSFIVVGALFINFLMVMIVLVMGVK